jgi:hypothetical protein
MESLFLTRLSRIIPPVARLTFSSGRGARPSSAVAWRVGFSETLPNDFFVTGSNKKFTTEWDPLADRAVLPCTTPYAGAMKQ